MMWQVAPESTNQQVLGSPTPTLPTKPSSVLLSHAQSVTQECLLKSVFPRVSCQECLLGVSPRSFLPRVSPKSVFSRVSSQECLPKVYSQECLPRGSPKSVFPRVSSQECLPRVSCQECLPRASCQECLPRVSCQECLLRVSCHVMWVRGLHLV